MKSTAILAAGLAVASARSIIDTQQLLPNQQLIDQSLYLLETAPGVTQWATEEKKWEFKRVSADGDILAQCS